MRGAALRLALPALLLLAARAGAGQAPAPETGQQAAPLTIDVDVDVVSVTAVVFDKGGHLVHGLGPKDVELLEDGVAQEVSYFREASNQDDPAARIPLAVALVLDTSGSMGHSLPFLQEAVLSFVYKLEDVDQTLVVSFNDTIKASVDFTSDTERLEGFVNGLQAWGGTSLNDAIHYALERIRDRPGRKAVVVFTDGVDTTSTTKESAVVDFARAVEATVYSVGFTGSGGTSRGFLHKLASETGGEFFAPGKVGELAKVFNQISEELKNHYLLSYTPKRPADRTWRRIELRVKRPGMEVRVRKGYFAVPRRRTEAPRG
jgi:Ca-activated chloride channel family protein